MHVCFVLNLPPSPKNFVLGKLFDLQEVCAMGTCAKLHFLDDLFFLGL